MVKLTGGRKFTKLDLSAAYTQMLLGEDSTKLVTVNTHTGLYIPIHEVAVWGSLSSRLVPTGILQGISHTNH